MQVTFIMVSWDHQVFSALRHHGQSGTYRQGCSYHGTQNACISLSCISGWFGFSGHLWFADCSFVNLNSYYSSCWISLVKQIPFVGWINHRLVITSYYSAEKDRFPFDFASCSFNLGIDPEIVTAVGFASSGSALATRQPFRWGSCWPSAGWHC